jgi:hypothetical protein
VTGGEARDALLEHEKMEMEIKKMPEETFHIIKQELITVTEKLEELCSMEKDIQDLRLEIKGLKLFLGRVHPEFKEQFPSIMKKMVKKA